MDLSEKKKHFEASTGRGSTKKKFLSVFREFLFVQYLIRIMECNLASLASELFGNKIKNILGP
jgi:hypothetical protein